MNRTNLHPTIRPFHANDQPRLVGFLERSFSSMGRQFIPEGKDGDIRDLAEVYLNHRGAFFVVDTGVDIEGCAGLRRFSNEVAELKRLYLGDAWRGHGLGRELCSAVIQAATDLGYESLRLDTTRQSPVALALFQNLGFHEIPRYNQDEFAEIFMEKKLA